MLDVQNTVPGEGLQKPEEPTVVSIDKTQQRLEARQSVTNALRTQSLIMASSGEVQAVLAQLEAQT